MRLATWNLWWQFGGYEARQPAILATLTGAEIDIAGLQETWPGQVSGFADALGFDHAWIGRRPDGRIGEPDEAMGNAVLSRWPIVRRDHRFLDDGKGRKYRTVLGVEVETPHGPLAFFVTHLSYANHESALRQAQLAEVAALIEDFIDEGADLRQSPLPPVLTGDLNAVPDSDEVRALTGRRPPYIAGRVWSDSWELVGDGPGITWSPANPYLANSAWPRRRLDYVLIGLPRNHRPIGNPTSAELIGTGAVDGVVASDHYGVIVDMVADRFVNRVVDAD